tara:strand:- start:12668 stop:15850 length:3183 start_codon:yes stop_codon:yes gene_type:complete
MAKIQLYKFINPGGAGADKLKHNAGRVAILGINRLGSTLNGIAQIVGDMGSIAKATDRVERLQEKAERRKVKREQDQAAEDELERRNALMGKGIKWKGAVKKQKKGFAEQFFDKIITPFASFFKIIGSWLIGLGAKLAMYEGLKWLADPANKHKIELFLHKLNVVWTKISGFFMGRIGNIMDGFTNLFGSGSTFGDRIKGLGQLILGFVGLGALLNPFGLMDAILSLLGWDWYRDKPQRGTNKGPNQGRHSRPGKTPKWTKTSSSINRRFGKNGNRLFDQYRRMGMSESEALKRVTRAARKNPQAFKPPKPTSGLTPGTAPKGKIIKPGAKPGLGKIANRMTLKFLGPNALKGVKGVFKNVFGRIPFFGAALTTLFSLMMGEPLDQALFKGGGSAIGGALGTLIPIPGVGSLVGMLVGEYVGDLMYTMFKGGGIKAVGERLKQDIKGVFTQVGNLINWVKKGFVRLYEGLPKWKIPELPKWVPRRDWISKWMLMGLPGTEIPNPIWLANPLNLWPKAKLFASAFFGDSAIPKGATEAGQNAPKELSEEEKKKISGATSGVNARKRAELEGKTPITNKRGRIVGWKDNKTGEITKEETKYKSDPNKRQMGRSAAKNRQKVKASNLVNSTITPTPDEDKNQWWDFLDWFPNQKKEEDDAPKRQMGRSAAKKRQEAQKKDIINQKPEPDKNKNQWWDFLDLFPNQSKQERALEAGKVEREENEWGPGGQPSASVQIKKSQSKSSWWNPFSWGKMRGGKILNNYGTIPPRLNRKQYFFGKIFRGISKAVSGVVKTVTNVVKSVASSPILNTILQVAPMIFPPAAPFIYGAQAVMSLAQGNILGAIAPAMGSLGHFFPGTFGAGSAIGKFMSGPIGKIGMGFLEGGVGGALSAGMGVLGGSDWFKGSKIGKFLQGNMGQTIGSIAANLIPGVANVPGLSQLFGMESFMQPMEMMQNLADSMGMGGMFKAISGMMSGGNFIQGLRELAPELGVDPRVLGVFDRSSNMFSASQGSSKQRQLSNEYAMQTAIEFVPVPMLIEKLVEIPKPVPINNPIPVPVPQKQQQK